MELLSLLLLGLVSLHLTSGIAPPFNRQNSHFEKYGMKIGPHFFDEEIKKLWDHYTVSGSEEELSKAEPAPSFKASDLFGSSTIVGKTMMTDIDNRTIYAWEGFRYGKPIDKETRFKPAVPEDNVFWTGDTFMADQMGFKCPQEAMIGHGVGGRADCLYLNIFTPHIPKTELATGLPVMFFVHGGGFIVGDASMYLPTRLLNHDVILVTIHYRLGAQGFWTLDNNDAPGNQALSDQILALKWVFNNIEEFGGDKNKITVFGESAGSVSVNYLMLTPQTAGLIAGVIAESGSALDNWAVDLDPRYAAMFIANDVGCNKTGFTDEDIFNCMLEVPDYDLVKAETHLVVSDRRSGLVGFRGAAPIIQTPNGDKNHDDQLVVTKHPRYYFLDGDFNHVPFMTGANKNEGSYVFSVMYSDYLLPNNLTENSTWLQEQAIQQILKGTGLVDETYLAANQYAEKYCPDIDRSSFNDSISCLIDLNGALFLKAGSWQTCKYHTLFSNHSAYYYSFDYTSEDTMYNWITSDDAYWDTGVTHSDELMYLFTMPYPMDGDQLRMEKILTLLWTNFATYQDPTPDSNPDKWMSLNIPKWTPYKYDDSHYMLIENEQILVRQDYSERWTISVDEDLRGNSTATVYPTETTTETPGNGDPCYDIQHKSDAYEITMIVFIVLFVIECASAIYFFLKARGK